VLEQVALQQINEVGALGNNINFVGPCNASFIPGNNTVIIDGCQLRDEIDRQFQVVYAQFLAALAKIAALKASIAYINTQVTYIETIIANITQNGLMTINGVGPGVGGAFTLASADGFLGVTTGPASNENRVANQAIVTMNNALTSDPATSDFQIIGGTGIGVVNDDAAGTVTINNLGAAPLCEITQTALSINGNLVVSGLAAVPILNYQYFDANFNSASTTSIPPNCVPNITQMFTRRGIADPFVSVINTFCKPEGRWLLQVHLRGQITYLSGASFLSLAFGLGSIGNNLPPYTLASMNLLTAGAGYTVPVLFTSQYTITNEAAACYEVVWICSHVVQAQAILNKWVLTRIN
jgi:hypothetical protein